MSLQIRPATLNDRAAIEALHHATFQPEESTLIAKLAGNLLDTPGTLTLIAENNSNICGHVTFSPLTLTDYPKYRASILAPLAVSPKQQKQGIGSKLVKDGLAQLKQQAVHDLYVYGDPNYYQRFGFIEASHSEVEAPYSLSYPFGWHVLQLSPTDSVKGKLSCVAALQTPQLW